MNVLKFIWKKVALTKSFIILAIVTSFSISAFPQFVSTTLTSPNAIFQGNYGVAVSGAGDINGDGYDDVMIGARSEDATYSDAGRAYIYNGKDGSLLFALTSPNIQSSGWFGNSVSYAGDINNDGYDDVVIGAPFESGGGSHSGSVYVISGFDGSLIRTINSPTPSVNGDFGFSVSGLGDVNDDMIPDIIVGARRENNWLGFAYIFSGTDGSLLQTLSSGYSGFVGFLGNSVSAIKDINNDNKDDVIVGAVKEDGGASQSGRVHLFSGDDGNLLFTIESPNPVSVGTFGNSVSSAGDINNDGTNDIIISAPNENSSFQKSGRAYIFSGVNGVLLYSLTSPNPEENGFFGTAVSNAGDLNKDNYDDVLIGASWEDGGASNSGKVYVISGESGNVMNTLVSTNPVSGGVFGSSVSYAGDLNNDSYPDIVIGALNEHGGVTDAGQAYIFTSDNPVTINELEIVSSYFLSQNYPNPFNPSTRISWQSPVGSQQTLKVYDMLGNEVATLVDEYKSAGSYAVEFNTTELTSRQGLALTSGIYFYKITAGEFKETKKMILLR